MKLIYKGDSMKPELVFAGEADTEQLRDIFTDYGMDLSGPIHYHVVVRDGTTVIGGAKLVQLEPDYFFLEVIGIRQDYWHQGYGSYILTHLTADPWKYCRQLNGSPPNDDSFAIGTLSKGSAHTFYQRHGFTPVSWSTLPEPYNQQCNSCPDRDGCVPTPMLYTGTRDTQIGTESRDNHAQPELFK
jgi:N-acetylglutamate synthase-like GNAT family acetyltransferase